MSQEEEIAELTEHFRTLGAEDPESWARSQVLEGIPQYATFVFLKAAWKSVIADGDTKWIKHSIRNSYGPGEGLGPALERLLATGADPEDIAEVVRVMQFWTLERVVSLISDSAMSTNPKIDVPPVHWALFETDEEGNVLHPLDSLHESILDLDPSGREMRPKEK